MSNPQGSWNQYMDIKTQVNFDKFHAQDFGLREKMPTHRFLRSTLFGKVPSGLTRTGISAVRKARSATQSAAS